MPTVAWPRRSLTTFGWTFAPRRSVACVCRRFIQFSTRSMPWSLFWPVVAWWRLGRVRAPALRRVGVMVAAIFAVELWMFQLVYPSIDGEQSAQGIARAAAARVPPGGSVGALSRAPLAAALRYYGGKPVEEIESADSMRSFLARGGRVIVAEAGKLDNVRSVAPMRITERVWSGDRTLFVLTPLDDAANERRADAPAGR